jgi:hypothetical protein
MNIKLSRFASLFTVCFALVACGSAPAATPVPASTSASVQPSSTALSTTAPAQPSSTTALAPVAAQPTAIRPVGQPSSTAASAPTLTQAPALVQAPSPTSAPSPTTAPIPVPAVPSAASGFVQIGDALNRDSTVAGTDPAITVGSLDAGKPGVPWAVWAEKQGKTQQIFVSKQNGSKFDPVGASLNIHSNVLAEGPSITFAGQDRTVPWTAWYEPSPDFANKKNVFASRFNAASGLWVPVGQDRGNNEASLNIHTNQLAQDPNIIGGTADPTKAPVAWVCWQEVSAHNNAVEIFVSRAVSDTTALGGFKWQPVGLNRSGAANDPEPSVNLDVTGGSNSSHCQIVFAETNNTVPWVVWAEKLQLNPTQIFVARAVTDATQGSGGFKWQFVPNNCTPQTAANCALNVNPTKEAFDPSMAAGTVIPGQATVPWIAWSEVGTTGKLQIFVDRLDQVNRNSFINVGASLNVDPNRDATSPSITFAGNVPVVAWSEDTSAGKRVFVRHLASDPQTGTWVLDTPKEGLAVDKTQAATVPGIQATPDGKSVLIWIQGDPDKSASKIVVCTNAATTSFARILKLAAPLWAGASCSGS